MKTDFGSAIPGGSHFTSHSSRDQHAANEIIAELQHLISASGRYSLLSTRMLSSVPEQTGRRSHDMVALRPFVAANAEPEDAERARIAQEARSWSIQQYGSRSGLSGQRSP